MDEFAFLNDDEILNRKTYRKELYQWLIDKYVEHVCSDFADIHNCELGDLVIREQSEHSEDIPKQYDISNITNNTIWRRMHEAD